MKFFYKILSAILLQSILFFSFSSVNAQVQTARYTSMAGNTNGFYEYLPQGYNPSGSELYPVLLFIHGMGELGSGNASELPTVLRNGPPKLINQGKFPTSFTVNGKTFRFIVISPQFVKWPQRAELKQIIEYIKSHYKADPSRIYLTGLSMGGGITWEYAGNPNDASYPQSLAAIVPVCGASWPEPTRAKVIAKYNLPVWALHNSNDPTVPVFYTNDYVDAINNASPAPNPRARKTIFNASGHDAWTKAYDPAYKENNMNVYEWMLQYSRGGSVPPPTNQLPVANAGADVSITLPSNTVQLNGNGSKDPDGSISAYSWSKISGPSSFSINNGKIVNPLLSNLTEGTYVVRLTVTDSKGATDSDDITIKISAAPASYKDIPGKIEAEEYVQMSGIQKEGTSDAGGGQNLGYVDPGDWIDYQVNVKKAGNYKVDFRVAAPSAGTQLQLRRADGSVLATLSIPKTGGYQTWVTGSVTATLPAGNQTLRVYAVTSGWNINWLEFSEIAPPVNEFPVANAGSDINVTLPVSTVQLNGNASKDPDGSITAYAWSKVSGPSSFSINNSKIVNPLLSGLAEGTYLLRLTVTDNQGAIDSDDITIKVLPAPSASKAVPGKIEAEAYDQMNGIQTENTSDIGGGRNVGWLDQGDWMDYNVNVTGSGSFKASFRVAAPNAGTKLQLRKEDGSVLTTIDIPKTGGYQSWVTSEATIALAAGVQVLRIYAVTSGWNINWLEFEETNPGSEPPPSTVSKSINVNVYGGSAPYNNSEWNNWKVSASAPLFRYSDGQSSKISASIDNPGSVADNGSSYSGGAAAPSEVNRHTSYAFVQRTLTITGLTASNKYDIELYASRNFNPGLSTVFKVGNASQTVNTYKNMTEKALFHDLVPNGEGKIIIAISSGQANTYNYLNGFKLIEKASVSTSASSDFSAMVNKTPLTDANGTGQMDGSLLSVYPNPVENQLNLQLNNNYSGQVVVLLFDINGKVRREWKLEKGQSFYSKSLLLNDLPSGNYILKVQLGSWSATKKIIKL